MPLFTQLNYIYSIKKIMEALHIVYTENTFISAIDSEDLKRIAEHGSSRRRKREYIKQGYDQQMSLYGVLTNKETKEHSYCRIEILSNTPYTELIVALIYNFFQVFKPTTCYTIWIYDKTRESIKMVGHYGPKTRAR